MCIFCEIVKGNIPCKKIYEDEKVLAFLDISQATEGHTLVVPKNHYDDMLTIPNDELVHLSEVVKLIANHYSKVLGITNFNFLNNCGEIAGQTVKHFHIHILPRQGNEDLKFEFVNHSPSSEELDKLAAKLAIK